MPAHHTHYYFGKLVFAKLPKEIQNLIEQDNDTKAAFVIGLQGPDILAFYRPIFKSELNIEGSDIHHSPGSLFFHNAVLKYKEKPTKIAFSYILGSLCHYLLDAACHPIINHYVRESDMSHALVEKEWDMAVLKMQEITAFEADINKLAPITKDAAKVISQFYKTTDIKKVMRAIKDMRRSISFLSMRNIYLRKLVCKILSSMELTKKQFDMVAQDFVDERSIASSLELQRKFDEVLDPAVHELEYFYHKLNSNDEINYNKYRLDYLGKQH